MSGKTDAPKGRINEATGASTGHVKQVAEKAVDKVDHVSPPMPRGKPARGNNDLCTEDKTDEAIGKVKQVAETAVVSPPMPRGKPARATN
jgi:uncharacterized protein YjbJ (UPF0337 family)